MKYGKVLLVSPKFCGCGRRLSVHPPAGLGYVAESLRRSGINVEVMDMNLGRGFSDLRRKLSDFKPDILGFTVMTFGYKGLLGMVEKIRTLYPDIRIVVGGPHISSLKEKVLDECAAIDYGVILEGDLSLSRLCMGDKPEAIQGLIFRKDGGISKNDFTEFIQDLDAVPFPRYESFELEKYPAKQIGIVTSRGCPYECIYCPVVSAIGKQFRCRSAESVVDEIEYWYKAGYREILILDDNFTLSRNRTGKICESLGKKNFKGISIKCPNGIRADMVDYELLKEMRRVGFDMVAFGVEAAEDRVLENIKKGEDAKTIERSIRDACSLGFDVDLFFLIGSPGERPEDFRASLALASRYPVRSANFYNIIPFPATELFKWIGDNGYFLRSRDDIINNASHFVNEPCFFTPEMSAADRKNAFRLGRDLSRSIKRKFIERKLKLPSAARKAVSYVYTMPFTERMMTDNSCLIGLRQGMKNIFLKKQDEEGTAY